MKRRICLIAAMLIYNVASSQQNATTITGKDSLNTFFPAMVLENPLSGGNLGLVVVGGSYENITRIARVPDANAGVYIGLGKPEKFIGGGVTVNIYGLSNSVGEKNNMGQGSLSFHVNKFILQQKLLIDAGLDNAVFWGADNQAYISYQRSFYFSGNYLACLKSNDIQKPFGYLSITAGAGNGYFRRDNNYTKGRSGSFDPFLSLATPVLKGTNIITEWNGYDIAAGISSIPVQKIPFMFTFEVTDLVFGKPRLIAAISFPFNFIKRSKWQTGLPVRPVGLKPIRPVRTI